MSRKYARRDQNISALRNIWCLKGMAAMVRTLHTMSDASIREIAIALDLEPTRIAVANHIDVVMTRQRAMYEQSKAHALDEFAKHLEASND